VIPDVQELDDWGQLDASDEESYTVAKGLEHKYDSTALLLVNEVCAAYCRFCFRKRLFMDENEEVTIYNVRFVNDWANNVYGDPLIVDFPTPVRDEDIFGALKAVTGALNAEDSIPLGASSEGTGQFFIYYKETSLF